MKTEKIGEVNFEEFKTEFIITPKVKKYLEKEGVSLTYLLPNGWEFYEVVLFDFLDDEDTGKPNKKYGKNFEVIFYGIVENRDLIEEDWDNENSKIKEKGFSENLGRLDKNKKFIYSSATEINSTPKNKNKKFDVKYIVRKK